MKINRNRNETNCPKNRRVKDLKIQEKKEVKRNIHQEMKIKTKSQSDRWIGYPNRGLRASVND